MSSCERIRPLLYRVAECEADPEESMRTARHLSKCTACRIVLAREARLARMLEEDLCDSLPVGEDFVRAVMASLPADPAWRERFGRRRARLAAASRQRRTL
jgi:predicted anti-sigma-YlaC factor YlaD